MGTIKTVNPVLISNQDITLESGKLMRVFWRDRTINNLMWRMKDAKKVGIWNK